MVYNRRGLEDLVYKILPPMGENQIDPGNAKIYQKLCMKQFYQEIGNDIITLASKVLSEKE